MAIPLQMEAPAPRAAPYGWTARVAIGLAACALLHGNPVLSVIALIAGAAFARQPRR